MFGNYQDAVRVIGSKHAAAFFAWLVVPAYDQTALERFCKPLGSGANLTEDDPRARLPNRQSKCVHHAQRLKTPAAAYVVAKYLIRSTGPFPLARL